MKDKRCISILLIIGIPTIYGLIIRYLFGIGEEGNLFSVMSITFLFCVPTIMGALAVYYLPEEKAKKTSYQIFIPWSPVIFFFFLTLIFSIEGWACWIMVLPFFLFAASVGGCIGAYFKLRKKDRNVYVTALIFLPFIAAPIENMIGTIPGTYKAYTYIDINAPANTIWDNVTSVETITEEEDRSGLTKWLNFPRPVEAVLNYKGKGAAREAKFTGGLVFYETVLEYIDQKKMVFSIKAKPYEIPSATMDEHIIIGGKYFDVLTGTYELEKINFNTYRLHLYSYFKLNTTFNFYASWWAKWIMEDIQNNILQVEKRRAEGHSSRFKR